MMVGALVLDDGTRGITEASQTRSPSMPLHLEVGRNHRHAVDAHLAGADRMVVGLGGAAGIVDQLVIGLQLGPGQHLARDVGAAAPAAA